MEREAWKGWTEGWPSLALPLPKHPRASHLLAALKVDAPFAKPVMFASIVHFWVSHNLDVPISFNLLFFFFLFFWVGKPSRCWPWSQQLDRARRRDGSPGLWGNIIGNNTFWASSLGEGLGEVKEKGCGWEGLKNKETKNKGVLDVFIGLCTKPKV